MQALCESGSNTVKRSSKKQFWLYCAGEIPAKPADRLKWRGMFNHRTGAHLWMTYVAQPVLFASRRSSKSCRKAALSTLTRSRGLSVCGSCMGLQLLSDGNDAGTLANMCKLAGANRALQLAQKCMPRSCSNSVKSNHAHYHIACVVCIITCKYMSDLGLQELVVNCTCTCSM